MTNIGHKTQLNLLNIEHLREIVVLIHQLWKLQYSSFFMQILIFYEDVVFL